MDYNAFIEEVKKEVEKRVGGEYEVKVHHVWKNNGIERKGLVIFKKGRREMSPTIYLEPFFRKWVEEFPMDGLVEEILTMHKEACEEEELELPNEGYELAKEAITYRLVSYEKNKGLLEEAPYIRFLDLAITFHYLFSSTAEGVRSFRVTNAVMQKWGTTAKELFQLANENTPKLFPIEVRSMDEVMANFLQDDWSEQAYGRETSPGEVVSEWFQQEGNRGKKFLVVTNTAGINGATSLLYPDVVPCIAGEWQSDVFVFPSSIHEVILTPYTPNFSDSYLNRMVREINQLEVLPEDVLSDHVYRYRRDTNAFEF